MERMWKEVEIMTTKYETLTSHVERLSQDVVNLKERKNGSAASTVAASSGSEGSTSNFAAHVMPNTFTPTRVELKGWEVLRNVRGTGITMDEARTLVTKNKAIISHTDLNKFNWN